MVSLENDQVTYNFNALSVPEELRQRHVSSLAKELQVAEKLQVQGHWEVAKSWGYNGILHDGIRIIPIFYHPNRMILWEFLWIYEIFFWMPRMIFVGYKMGFFACNFLDIFTNKDSDLTINFDVEIECFFSEYDVWLKYPWRLLWLLTIRKFC